MLIVTHEMRFARQVSTRVVFMDGGAMVEHAPPDEFFDSPKAVRLREFLGNTAL